MDAEKKSKIKKRLIEVGLFFVLFVAFWLLSFFVTYITSRFFSKFGYDTLHKFPFLIALIPTILASIILVTIILLTIKSKISTLNKLQRAFPSVALFVILTLLFLHTIINSDSITINNMDSLLTIEWTIFGISLAVFIFWLERKLTRIEELSKITLEEEKTIARIKEIQIIEEAKNDLSEDVPTIIFMTLNLLALLVSTAMFYLYCDEIDTEILNIFFMFSTLLTTNCLIQISSNIVTAFFNKRRALLKKKPFSVDYNIEKEIDETCKEMINNRTKEIKTMINSAKKR